MNMKIEIRPYSYQKISSGPTDSDYKIRDKSRFMEWGPANKGSGEWKWQSPQNQGLGCTAPIAYVFAHF